MKREDINKVKACIRKYGDSFWTDKERGTSSNDELFNDIISAVNKAGYDLTLIKREDITFGK